MGRGTREEVARSVIAHLEVFLQSLLIIPLVPPTPKPRDDELEAGDDDIARTDTSPQRSYEGKVK
jgi:hypothetical protein